MSSNTNINKTSIETELGEVICGDSALELREIPDNSVNLIMTSPPFGLIKKKEYGNVPADDYLAWFEDFAKQFHRILQDNGSLVIDIGGTWQKGLPTRHLYHFELLILLCKNFGFHLAQEFYWWNPAKLPTPAEWVNIRRIRVKDAVNTVWWLSKTPWPKADNRRVLQKYSKGMDDLLANGYQARLRPSGHNISEKFSVDNGGAIPPNLLAIANTESNSAYLRYCRENELKAHPARFPADLPEFFIRMLTDENDVVVDPFAGSCITGEVCERLGRRWKCVELREDYVEGARGRFLSDTNGSESARNKPSLDHYKAPRPSLLWDDLPSTPLASDGGRVRATTSAEKLEEAPKKEAEA